MANGKKSTDVFQKNKYLIAIVVILEIAVLAFSYYATFLGIYVQWGIALASLLIVGSGIRILGGFQGWQFIYLIGSKHGLKSIDGISKRYGQFWNLMAVWGLVLGFGILSYPFLKKKIGLKSYVFGLASLAIILFLILPFLAFAIPFIQIPQLQGAFNSAGTAQAGINWLGVFFDALTMLTGFAGYVFIAIWGNALSILGGIASFITSVAVGHPQTSTLTSQIPGVAPIIPGVDIPLFAGVISLAILLIIHEFSHGILARGYKIKLKSIGLALLGIIPIGAFVEPDEKAVNRLDGFKQSKIISAGISANFVAMVVFFAIMALFLYLVVPGITQNLGVFVYSTLPGYPAYNVLTPGTQILYWNGYRIHNLTSFTVAAKNDSPGSLVTVGTINGTYKFTAVAENGTTRGVIGVSVTQNTQIAKTFYAGTAYFLYTIFALSFLLNFLVGAVNLLPLPGLDGWRIYEINIRDKRVVKVLAMLILIGILINVLPWFFYI